MTEKAGRMNTQALNYIRGFGERGEFHEQARRIKTPDGMQMQIRTRLVDEGGHCTEWSEWRNHGEPKMVM